MKKKRRVEYLKDLDFFVKRDWNVFGGNMGIEVWDADDGREMKELDVDMRDKIYIDMKETAVGLDEKEFYDKIEKLQKNNK